MKSNREKALFYAQKTIAQTITDVVNLEDINFTVPEVQTLLDGITIGGHKIQDELITYNQINAWRYLFDSLRTKEFNLSKEYILKLHSLVANQEALVWGEFRSGQVTISGTNYIPPKAHELDSIFSELIIAANKIYNLPSMLSDAERTQTIYKQSIELFAQMARYQFFYDGNKRTARMIMSGLLIDLGYPMISISAKHKTNFNKAMINFYDTQDILPLERLFLLCLETWLINEFT